MATSGKLLSLFSCIQAQGVLPESLKLRLFSVFGNRLTDASWQIELPI